MRLFHEENYIYFLFVPTLFANVNQAQKNWLKCAKTSYHKGRYLPFSKDPGSGNPKFVPQCSIDTIYSWQNLKFIKSLAAKSTPNNVLPFGRSPRGWKVLYFWRTPAGIHAYNKYFIRVKLRPQTKFILIGDIHYPCELPKFKNKLKDSLFVRFYRNLKGQEISEYMLCSSGPVASWSYGTRESYNELNREINWILEKDTTNWEPFVKTRKLYLNYFRNKKVAKRNLVPMEFRESMTLGQLFKATETNKKKAKEMGLGKLVEYRPATQFLGYHIDKPQPEWSLGNLYIKLVDLYRMFKSPSQHIYYSKGIPKNPKNHFKTRYPNFFNPN
jgi:hypothetical protein